jgi:hypothetical protein
MSIPAVANSVLRYMHSFDLVAIARSRDGRLVSTRDPAGHEQAWWLNSLDVGRVLRVARADSLDVVKAAATLGVRLVEHGAALQRTEQIVAKLDARLDRAQRAGDLGFFNRTYKLRRQQAQAEGRSFMPYSAAQARLRKAIVGVAAGEAPAIVARVFGPQ